MSNHDVNEEINPKQGFTLHQIITYLPLGYVYLLALGIVSDTIYYGMIGINIISYSTVLDVLLSPLSRIADSLLFGSFIIGMPIFAFFYMKFIKWTLSKSKKAPKRNFISNSSFPTQVTVFSAILIFSAFMGFGFGGGSVIKERVNSGDIKINSQITFHDESTIMVEHIGNNSGFIFYVTNGDKHVSVSPISMNIRRIEMIGESGQNSSIEKENVSN